MRHRTERTDKMNRQQLGEKVSRGLGDLHDTLIRIESEFLEEVEMLAKNHLVLTQSEAEQLFLKGVRSPINAHSWRELSNEKVLGYFKPQFTAVLEEIRREK